MKKAKKSFLKLIIEKLYPFFSKFNILALLIILLSFFLLAPSFSKKNEINKFLREINEEKSISPEKFWELRERYSTGYFQYNNEKVTFKQTFRLTSVENTQEPILEYKSSNIKSWEYLSQDSTIAKEILASSNSKEILVKNKQNLVYTDPEKNLLTVYFVRPTEEMMRVNGFFDYLKSERELIKDYYWHSKSEISLP